MNEKSIAAAGDNRRIETYAEFWPYYLQEHAKPVTRGFHYFGTSLAIASLIAGFFLSAWFLPLALVAGYGPAWAGHFFIEKNQPATFKYPLWSLISDFRMTFVWATGGLRRELDRAGVA